MPVAVYQLAAMNFILFVGLVIRDLSVAYIIGSFVFVTLLTVVIASNFKLFPVPTCLLTENIKYSLSELNNKATSMLDKLSVAQLGSETINTIVTVFIILKLDTVCSVLGLSSKLHT